MATPIDGLVQRHRELSEYLVRQKEISLRSEADSQFRKTLLLSVASYFENELTDAIVAVVSECVGTAVPILEFVKNKAIARQYHTFFAWDRPNANSFFGLFGGSFRDFISEEVRRSPKRTDAIKAFLELGNLRNQMVHQNFATFPLEKTVDEIYELYKRGLEFVEQFPADLRQYCTTLTRP
jgi:hypothetical protein